MSVRHTITRLPAALSLAAAAASLTAVALPAPAHAAPSGRGPSVLRAGQTLAPGRSLAARRSPPAPRSPPGRRSRATSSSSCAELDVVGMSSDGSVGGVSHAFRTKSAAANPYLVMQEDGNLVVYPPNQPADGDTAEWATGTNGNPGAWATLLLSGEVMQVLSAPVVSPGDSRMLLPQTAVLYENEKPDHGANNAALLGPTVVPLD